MSNKNEIYAELDLEELEPDELIDLQKMIIKKDQLNHQIDTKMREIVRKILFKEYDITFWNKGEKIFDGFTLRRRNTAGGYERIPTEEISRIEKATHTKLNEMQNYEYEFIWDYLFEEEKWLGQPRRMWASG